jgi:hypothetical protein
MKARIERGIFENVRIVEEPSSINAIQLIKMCEGPDIDPEFDGV